MPRNEQPERLSGNGSAAYAELECQNRELERRMLEDGRQFLEHIAELEKEIEILNSKMLEDKAGGGGRGDADLRAENERMARECRDTAQQLDEFEREKEEELRQAHEETALFRKRMGEQAQAIEELKRRNSEMERDKAGLLEAMSQEGIELNARLDKVHRDKEALSLDLGRAQARVEHLQAQVEELSQFGSNGQTSNVGAREYAEASAQLRAAISERESLKDEVTNKDGQIVLLQSKLEIAERKLRLADMTNNMLKSELEVMRHQTPPQSGVATLR